jgi:hypothetical protein
MAFPPAALVVTILARSPLILDVVRLGFGDSKQSHRNLSGQFLGIVMVLAPLPILTAGHLGFHQQRLDLRDAREIDKSDQGVAIVVVFISVEHLASSQSGRFADMSKWNKSKTIRPRLQRRPLGCGVRCGARRGGLAGE